MKPEGTELCNELNVMLAECLHHYQKVNGNLPARIIYYRLETFSVNGGGGAFY